MGIIRKTLRYSKVTIGCLFALAVLIYIIFVVVNWNDQPQSKLFVKITNELGKRVKIEDNNNAHVFILGFDAPPDLDPFVLGADRYAWEEKALETNNFEHSDYPLEDDDGFKSGISESVNELFQSCKQAGIDCLAAIEKGMTEGHGHEWFTNENWLLDRYSSLIKLNEYQNLLPYDVNIPLSSFSEVFNGQRLYLAKSWVLVSEDNYDLAQVMLEDDLKFWRMILLNSDVLITKMIATAAIRNHFKFGNLVLRQAQAGLLNDVIPPSWKAPLSIEERSLRRCLIGEWQFMDRLMDSISDGDYQYLYGSEEPTIWEKAFSKIGLQFWKSQDTSNKHLKNMTDIAKLFDVNYEEIPNSISEVDKFIEAQSKLFFSIYNPIGNILIKIGLPAYDDYGIRVSDLEGIRRAVLVTAEVRANAANVDDINEFLKSSELREPYWSRQFEWDQESNSILFYGLESGERGLHKLML